MTSRPTGPTPPTPTADAAGGAGASPGPAPTTLDVPGTPIVAYAAPSTGVPPTVDPARRPGATGIRVTVGVTVLFTIGVVALIFVRWVNSRFPSSCIQFTPNTIGPGQVESLDGVEIRVSEGRHEIATVRLGDHNGGYVLVDAGKYTVTQSYRGVPTAQGEVEVGHKRIVMVPVTTQPTRPAPAAGPDQ